VSTPRIAIFLALVVGSACAVGAPDSGACGDQSKVSAADRVKNTAHWTTASEEENFGYDVYRGDSESGPFVKLTKQPILGNGTTLETHKYEYADDAIDPCRDYWYYVESIGTDGTREKFTPVFHVPPKRHAEGASAAKPVK
jgi:chitodextrinase